MFSTSNVKYEWKHETDCTVSQNDSINFVHSCTLDLYKVLKMISKMRKQIKNVE